MLHCKQCQHCIVKSVKFLQKINVLNIELFLKVIQGKTIFVSFKAMFLVFQRSGPTCRIGGRGGWDNLENVRKKTFLQHHVLHNLFLTSGAVPDPVPAVSNPNEGYWCPTGIVCHWHLYLLQFHIHKVRQLNFIGLDFCFKNHFQANLTLEASLEKMAR